MRLALGSSWLLPCSASILRENFGDSLKRRLFSSCQPICTISTGCEIQVENTVIGAGVVGLAVAAALSQRVETLVVEQHPTFACETSSRNSEVIHSGIYYPPTSLKTKLCIRGNSLLYSFCERHKVPYKRIGKWVVAVEEASEVEYLNKLKKKADDLGVKTEWMCIEEAMRIEPAVKAKKVLVCPNTGIVDSHALCAALESQIHDCGSDVIYHAPVTAITYDSSSKTYTLDVPSQNARIHTRNVINATGLHADKTASYLPFPAEYLQQSIIYPSKGTYYTLRHPPPVSRLIYPVPPDPSGLSKGLGTHCTLDMTGRLKFGPDARLARNKYDFGVDDCTKEVLEKVAGDVGRYLKGGKDGVGWHNEDVQPDYVGIRPKLSLPNQPFRDFIIAEETQHGFPGFVNLLGIESPGLTSSLAIAEMVAELLGFKRSAGH